MDSTGDTAHMTFSPTLLAKLEAVAAEEHRPAVDVASDFIEHALNERSWRLHAEQERQRARELGIHDPADDEPMTDEYRQVLREKISQGLQSLREGRFVDGEEFMARMDSELAELERQGH